MTEEEEYLEEFLRPFSCDVITSSGCSRLLMVAQLLQVGISSCMRERSSLHD